MRSTRWRISRDRLEIESIGSALSLSASKSSKDADGGKSSGGTSKASSSGKMGEGEGEDKASRQSCCRSSRHQHVLSASKADALNRRKAKVRRLNDTWLRLSQDMVQEGPETHSMDDFASQFYPNLRKGGLIIDVATAGTLTRGYWNA